MPKGTSDTKGTPTNFSIQHYDYFSGAYDTALHDIFYDLDALHGQREERFDSS